MLQLDVDDEELEDCGIEELYVQPQMSQTYSLGVNWNLSDTDMPYYNQLLKDPDYYRREKGVEGRIEYLTPEQYMTMAGQIHRVSRAREYEVIIPRLLKQYAERMKAGVELPLPVIDLAAGLQEGRHRVAAAQWLGEHQVPVLVVRWVDISKEIPTVDWR